MTTLYVDVFFFINFTVDILALYYSCSLLHIKTSMIRLCGCSFFGAIISLVQVLSKNKAFSGVFLTIAWVCCLYFFCCRSGGIGRRIRMIVLFFLFEVFIGGIVYLLFEVFERTIGAIIGKESLKAENKKVLVLALIILLFIGVIKLMIILFCGTQHKNSVRVRITLGGKTMEADALMDSGNLTKDPMGMRPVVFIKKGLAYKLMPKEATELNTLDLLDQDMKKRVRLIPVSRLGDTHVMAGIMPDKIEIAVDNNYEEYDMTLAIDREGGSFGGYEALVPSCVLK